MPKKLTTEEFIRRARKVHGDFYDYSKVVYKRMDQKVCIIDPEYGEFWQQPNNHLMGKHSMARTGTPKKTKEKFIEEARKVHGDLYDYSKVDYKGTNTKVCIIDPEYGEWWQEPSNHLQGYSHPKRGNKKISKSLTKTLEDFIKQAREVHGDLYDYSQVDYKHNQENICIIDPEYGEFWQTPSNHLRGKGCPSRGRAGFDPNKAGILYYLRIMDGKAYKIGITNKSVEKRFMGDMRFIDILKTWYYPNGYDAQEEERKILHEYRHAKYYGPDLLSYARTFEMFRYDVLDLDNAEIKPKNYVERDNHKSNNDEFIAKARKVHGDLYDYSKVDYINNRTKVIIIDPEYGEFLQTPTHHLRGYSSPERSGRRRLDTERFIKLARKVHGDLYNYSKVEYTSMHTKVLIIDPEYGEFWQIPSNHLNGSGHIKRKQNRRLTTEEFIKRAREKHGDKYDYSKVKYEKSNIKVTIIDPEYGNEFKITPSNHLYGEGNPLRVNNKRKTTQQFIKEAREVHGDLYDYSKVRYVNAKTKVTIIDPVYGEFDVRPTNHLSQGNGHPLRAKDRRRNFNLEKEMNQLELNFQDDDI